MSVVLLFFIFVLLFATEIGYFKLADYFNIIDSPNHRSSHTNLTIRGGGIIFFISVLFYSMYFGIRYEYFLLGLTIIAITSFVDDIKPISNKLRIVFHLISVLLMFYQLGLFNLEFYYIIIAMIFVIGGVNAINFMDGINGITGAYSLITLCTLLFINIHITEFIDPNMLITIIISVLVFNYFNFRKKAKCFAGDVGSVSIAFIIMFILLKLIIKTENPAYLLLLLLYGLDAITTIFFRLIRKENIFDAHRSHFYQYWANEKMVPHLVVSLIYAMTQLVINILIIFCISQSLFVFSFALLLSTMFFVVLRFYTEGSSRLLGN